MKINRTTGIPNANLYHQTNQESKSKFQAELKKDEVQISHKAKIMLEKSSQVDAARQEKIKGLSEQIDSGHYHVDSGQVAEKIYQFWFAK